jgi:hypothetical protein
MGDYSDFNDVGRFMRSAEGQQALENFRKVIEGRTIVGVVFTHNATGVGIVIALDDGDAVDMAESLELFAVETLRRQYMAVLEREYYLDFPNRRPADPATPTAQVDPVDPADLRCPACGQSEAFTIEAWQHSVFYHDGTVTGSDEGQQWDHTSPCRCEACGHEAKVGDFAAGGG